MENLAVFQPQISLIVIVYLVLLLLGILYNVLVAFAEKSGILEGYTALAVVIGVLFTLIGVAVINWKAALLTLGGFVFSGSPMIVGEITRYAEARKKEKENVRQAATVAEHGERI
jgi:hypothetical protein